MTQQQTGISRRQFHAWVLGAAAGWMARGESWAAESAGPKFGIGTRVSMAAAVKEAGGDFIAESVAGFLDPDGPEAEFEAKLEELRQSPLPMLTCNSFIRRPDLHCTGPEANHDEVMAYCTRAFGRARRAGVKLITFGSSGSRQLPDGFPEREGMEQFVALLKRMGPPAAEHGVTVVVEPLQQRECNFINRIGHVEEAVRRAGHPAIRGTADLYHMIIEGDTPADLAKAADIVSHVEIAETEGRRMPGASGQDFRPFFKVLKDAGFAGTIMVEGRWEPSELPTGFAEMRKQWREA